jgi:hypothetical protein
MMVAGLTLNAGAEPEGSEPDFQGKFTRMGRIAFDPESGRRWVSFLRIDMNAYEVDTEWGPTRVTYSQDAVMVKFRNSRKYSAPVDVSGGSTDAKLDPRIAARAGRVCATWAAYNGDSKQWRIFAAYSKDGSSWNKPVVVAGSAADPALHPSVAMDPETGVAWIAYEDWGDGSIRLVKFDGASSSQPVRISEGGRNFRPKVIVTAGNGKHRGAVATAWDAYRDRQYHIYLRLRYPDGDLSPEHRATECARWDSQVDMIEDLDSNLWIAWVRASTELGEMSGMRDVHAKFFDGDTWFYPSVPEQKYNPGEIRTSWKILGMEPPDDGLRQSIINSGNDNGDGRITWFKVNWYPRLAVDKSNRVYLFYRQGHPLAPPLYCRINYRVYEQDRWSRQQAVRLGRGINLIRMLQDFSVTITDGDAIEGVWDQCYINMGKEVLSIQETKKKSLPRAGVDRFRVRGEAYGETMRPGYSEHKELNPPRTTTIDGKPMRLLFGDTHAHSFVSVGVDPPDYYYHIARDIAKFDYFALPENDYFFCGTPGSEAYIAFLAREFNSDEFMVFHAHEFVSSAMGHRVMVFEGEGSGLFPIGVFNSQRGNRVNTTGHLYHYLHRFDVSPTSRVMVSSHNMTNLGNDFREYDPSLEPLYDVGSVHIEGEKTFAEYKSEGRHRKETRPLEILFRLSMVGTGGKRARIAEKKWYYSWRESLDAGLILGAYGSSDNHSSNGIGFIFSGVWVAEKNKKAVFDALFARRTFAVDNQLRLADIFNTDPASSSRNLKQSPLRMDIRFRVDDHFMGSICDIDGPPTARVSVFTQEADNPVKKIIFVKDGEEVHETGASEENVFEAAWRDDKLTPGEHYYYVRVEFKNGNIGYSSPVFVNYRAHDKC